MPVDEASTLSPPSIWVDTYGDYLYGFAFYRVQDEELARELVHDTLLAALKAKDSFAGRGSEKTWRTGILKHKIIDYLRRKYRDAVFEDQEIDERKIHDSFDHNGRWKTGPAQWTSDPEHLPEQKVFIKFGNRRSIAVSAKWCCVVVVFRDYLRTSMEYRLNLLSWVTTGKRCKMAVAIIILSTGSL